MMRKLYHFAAMVILAAFLANIDSAPAGAQPASLSDFYMGNNLVLWNADEAAYSPAIAYNSQHDEYLVVWENIHPGGAHDIYARRVSGNGQMLNSFAVSVCANSCVSPAVAYDSNNDRYLVVWTYDYLGNGTDLDIRGRYIPWNGPSNTLIEFQITWSNANELKPRIAYGLASDTFLVVYLVATPGNPFAVAGKIVHDYDTVYLDIAKEPENRDFPDVAYNAASNEYLVVWEVGKSITGLDIDGVRLKPTGEVLPPGEFAIADGTTYEQHPAAAACSQANQYLVVWLQQAVSGKEIYGRFMTGDGSLSPVVPIETAVAQHQAPDLTCNQGGTEYLLAWQAMSTSLNSHWGIRGRWIKTDQTLEDAFEVVAASPTGDRGFPAVAGGKVSYLAAWEHQRDSFGLIDIWGRTLIPNVNFLPYLRTHAFFRWGQLRV